MHNRKLNVGTQRNNEIVREIVIDREAYLGYQAHNSHYENDLLNLKPYRSFEIPQSGIFGLPGVHIKTP